MVGILILGATTVIVVKAADMGNRNSVLWGAITVGLGILISLVVGMLIAGFVTTVIMLGAMFVANMINDPTKAKPHRKDRYR